MEDLSQIEHVVVLMLENRSFDHVLGSLEHTRPEVDGVVPSHLNAGQGGSHETGPLTGERARVFEPDPPHDADKVAVQMSAGMTGFVRAFEEEHPDAFSPGDVIRHLTREHQPITYFLADEYTICQRWFSPVPTQTIPNRLYSIAGHGAGLRDNPGVLQALEGFDIKTIFGEMMPDEWAVYAGALPATVLVNNLRDQLFEEVNGIPRRLHRLEHFAEDAANGALPKLTWIEPLYSWANTFWNEPNDDHPPSDVMRGQELIREVYDALTSNAARWRKTVLVITYDEHGGFYDHVVPPAIAESESVGDSFEQRGPRVPTLVVSPFARRGAVVGSHDDVYDHCSLLKFLCDWLGIAPFSARIGSAQIKSLADLLVDQPRADVPVAPDAMGMHSRQRLREVAMLARAPVPPESATLLPGPVPELMDDMRLRLERDYGESFRELYPELAAMPAVRKVRGVVPARDVLRSLGRSSLLVEARPLRDETSELREAVIALTLENQRLKKQLASARGEATARRGKPTAKRAKPAAKRAKPKKKR